MKLGKGNLIVTVDSGDSASSRATSKRRGRRRPDDILFSVAYACTDCGVSFEPPSPQLFSFNSPQGMCPECDGLGQLYSFDPDLLIPEPNRARSFKKGCFALLGTWKDLGRWRRHIYKGVADTMEQKRGRCSPA